MKPEVLLELLETAAEQLGVRVSYEVLQSSVVHGGLCRVKGQHRIIVDKRATSEERVVTLATSLASIPAADLAAIELVPQVRELLAAYGFPRVSSRPGRDSHGRGSKGRAA